MGLGPVGPHRQARNNMALQQAHQLGLCMFAYSQDHDGKYPDGKSSTEVFQKLLDGNYVTDPGIFFFPCPGKVKASPGQKVLKPENVSFDVTEGADANSPDTLPLLYLTGYKVTYSPGVAPVAYFKIFPDGIAVFYKGNNAIFLKAFPQPDSPINNFIPPDFKPNGHTYRQLTPDGSLP